METYLERFQQVCLQHLLLKKSLIHSIIQNPDRYAQELLTTKGITAELAQPYLLVWPCKPIQSWGILQNGTDDACTLEVPIWYFDVTNHTGYLLPSQRRIYPHSSRIDCSEQRPVPFIMRNMLYLFDKGRVHQLAITGLKRVTMINNPQRIAPVWENQWIYSNEEFISQGPRYLTLREIEEREQSPEEKENKEYNAMIKIPFLGIPVLPSLTRICELISMGGGLLYLIHLIKRRVQRYLERPKRLTLSRSYRLYKRGASIDAIEEVLPSDSPQKPPILNA